MSEWIRNILKPLINEAVDESVNNAFRRFTDEKENEYYKGVAYGDARTELKKDQEHEQEQYRMFNEGRKYERQAMLAERGEIEEISAEEFDRLASQPPEPTAKTEIPDNFGFVGTMDDISLVLDESEAV